MTRAQLLQLRRGDVVVWKQDGELGIVTRTACMVHDGVEVRWAAGQMNFYTVHAADEMDKFVQAPPEPPKPRHVKVGDREVIVAHGRVVGLCGADFEAAILRIIELEDELALERNLPR